MTEAERLIRARFAPTADARLDPFDQSRRAEHLHPDVEFSLFGITGTKEAGRGREAYFAFVRDCFAALADRSDELLNIVAIDEQCVFVRVKAYRKSAATGEDICYEWSSLTRVEDGMITYATDMLDRDAQEFWGRIRG